MRYKAKKNSKGKCPVRCRITFNRTRKELSTGISINLKHWSGRQQTVEPPEQSCVHKDLRKHFVAL
ncbi:Arm DNA-binding domain-containing protein [Mangrovimonas sp. TPBH4]|uniref:Arm DNA-binding domain-containing protein n=1 Tax=Mangrovimonas sp. TPBH4 TaxID=1645914 RepID=UPI0018D1A244